MAKKKKTEPVELAVNLWDKAKTVKGDSVVKLLQKTDYKGCPVYIRQIGHKMFEYLLVYKKEIWTGFNIIEPAKGKKKLNKDQVAQCGALIFTGAITTIDMLMEKDKELVGRCSKCNQLLAKKDDVIVH